MTLLEKYIAKVEEMKVAECNEGGFGHEHNPWGCGETPCAYCKHIQEGKCKNGMSSVETDVHNNAISQVQSLLPELIKEVEEETRLGMVNSVIERIGSIRDEDWQDKRGKDWYRTGLEDAIKYASLAEPNIK